MTLEIASPWFGEGRKTTHVVKRSIQTQGEVCLCGSIIAAKEVREGTKADVNCAGCLSELSKQATT